MNQSGFTGSFLKFNTAGASHFIRSIYELAFYDARGALHPECHAGDNVMRACQPVQAAFPTSPLCLTHDDFRICERHYAVLFLVSFSCYCPTERDERSWRTQKPAYFHPTSAGPDQMIAREEISVQP